MATQLTSTSVAPLPFGRVAGFAIGDYGLNLFWQSVSLFLLYFYTDVVGLSAGTAGLIYLAASIWDAVSDPIMGALADRTRTRWGRYRPYILWGAVPLCLSFALMYYRPPLAGTALVIALAVAQMLFRTCYTVVAVPYTSLMARMTSDSRDRTTLAGARMMFGILAAMTVAYITQPLAYEWSGGGDDPRGWFLVAVVTALGALFIFPVVFVSTREPAPEEDVPPPPSPGKGLVQTLRSNRAFWIVIVGLTCVIGSQIAFGKSVLYYFKYYLRDEGASHLALTLYSAVGLVVIPLWVFVTRRLGKRFAWFAASAWGAAGLIYFLFVEVGTAWHMTLFMLYLQSSLLGLGTLFWAMLPDTIEYGEWRGAVRAESFLFGLAQFFLKIGLGIAAAIFGLAFDYIGYVANVEQSADTLAAMKLIMGGVPLALIAIGILAMLFYPMRGDEHARIVRELAQRRAAGAS